MAKKEAMVSNAIGKARHRRGRTVSEPSFEACVPALGGTVQQLPAWEGDGGVSGGAATPLPLSLGPGSESSPQTRRGHGERIMSQEHGNPQGEQEEPYPESPS